MLPLAKPADCYVRCQLPMLTRRVQQAVLGKSISDSLLAQYCSLAPGQSQHLSMHTLFRLFYNLFRPSCSQGSMPAAAQQPQRQQQPVRCVLMICQQRGVCKLVQQLGCLTLAPAY